MHLHKLEGAWIDHPFWKTRFTLVDGEDLRKLRASVITEVWIDNALGLDVAPPQPLWVTPQRAPTPHETRSLSMPSVSPAASAPPATDTLAGELHRAAAICKKSRGAVMSMFNEARLGNALDAENCLPLVDEITQSVGRNPSAMVSLARLKTVDDYSFMHSVAVCALMVSLGQQLGMDSDACRAAGLGGLLHDLGKAAIPLDILNKPGKLTDEEFGVIKTHPLRGHEMLVEGRGAGVEALDVCLHHHERPDGKGYPHGLAGDDVTLFARMGSVCDVYDAITSNRPYKAGWDPADSIAKMASWKGQFDEAVFKAFVRSMGIYPTGSLVRLESRRLAVVMEQTPGSLATPIVKMFFSIDQQMHIRPAQIDLSRPGCGDRIVGRESPADWGFHSLHEFWVDPELLRRSRST